MYGRVLRQNELRERGRKQHAITRQKKSRLGQYLMLPYKIPCRYTIAICKNNIVSLGLRGSAIACGAGSKAAIFLPHMMQLERRTHGMTFNQLARVSG